MISMKSIPKGSLNRNIHNDSAILDLPLYLVVTMIIGIIALTGILSMIVLPSYFNPTPVLSITPVVTSINTSSSPITYQALVTSSNGKPIKDAHVIIKNGQAISTNTTDEQGKSILTIQATIPIGLHECYFDVIVKYSNHHVTYPQLLKVVLWR